MKYCQNSKKDTLPYLEVVRDTPFWPCARLNIGILWYGILVMSKFPQIIEYSEGSRHSMFSSSELVAD